MYMCISIYVWFYDLEGMAYGKFTCICLPKLKQIYESKWIISPGRVENKQQLANHHLVLQIISSILHGHLKDSFETSSSSPKENMVHPKIPRGKGPVWLFFSKQHLRIGICAVAEQGLGNAVQLQTGLDSTFGTGIILHGMISQFVSHFWIISCQPFLENLVLVLV